jgi:hypothetical protein
MTGILLSLRLGPQSWYFPEPAFELVIHMANLPPRSFLYCSLFLTKIQPAPSMGATRPSVHLTSSSDRREHDGVSVIGTDDACFQKCRSTVVLQEIRGGASRSRIAGVLCLQSGGPRGEQSDVWQQRGTQAGVTCASRLLWFEYVL